MALRPPDVDELERVETRPSVVPQPKLPLLEETQLDVGRARHRTIHRPEFPECTARRYLDELDQLRLLSQVPGVPHLLALDPPPPPLLGKLALQLLAPEPLQWSLTAEPPWRDVVVLPDTAGQDEWLPLLEHPEHHRLHLQGPGPLPPEQRLH